MMISCKRPLVYSCLVSSLVQDDDIDDGVLLEDGTGESAGSLIILNGTDSGRRNGAISTCNGRRPLVIPATGTPAQPAAVNRQARTNSRC